MSRHGLMVLLVWGVLFVSPTIAAAQGEAIPCTPEPTEMHIGYGTVIACQFEPGDAEDKYVFETLPGEHFVVVAVGTNVQLTIRALGGGCHDCVVHTEPYQPLSWVQFGAGGSATRYTVEVRMDSPGPYTLILERFIPASPLARRLTPGVTLSDTIDPKADLDVFYFDAFAGDTFSLEVAPIGDVAHPCMELYSPGSPFAFVTKTCDDGSDVLPGRIRALAGHDGQYVAVIRDRNPFRGKLPYNITLDYTPSFVCDAAPAEATYSDGENVSGTIQLTTSRRPGAVPVEAKLWLELPDGTVYGLINQGTDGTLKIAPGHDEVSPFTLFTVAHWMPRGVYSLGCRLLDPVTGGLKGETIRPFLVQ